MEIVRAFGLTFIVLFVILAVTAAIVIVINMVTGGTLYITGSADNDLVTLVDILATILIVIICRRMRRNASRSITSSAV